MRVSKKMACKVAASAAERLNFRVLLRQSPINSSLLQILSSQKKKDYFSFEVTISASCCNRNEHSLQAMTQTAMMSAHDTTANVDELLCSLTGLDL
jgi:hypothetical protein